jgi:hypothetical protein
MQNSPLLFQQMQQPAQLLSPQQNLQRLQMRLPQLQQGHQRLLPLL